MADFQANIVDKQASPDGLKLILKVEFSDGITTYGPLDFAFNNSDLSRIAQTLQNQCDQYTKNRDAKDLPSGIFDVKAVLSPPPTQEQLDAHVYQQLVSEYLAMLRLANDPRLAALAKGIDGKATELLDAFKPEYLLMFGALPL